MEAIISALFSSVPSKPNCDSSNWRYPSSFTETPPEDVAQLLSLGGLSVTIWPALAPTTPAVTPLHPASLNYAPRGATLTYSGGTPGWDVVLQSQAGEQPGPCPQLRCARHQGLLWPVSNRGAPLGMDIKRPCSRSCRAASPVAGAGCLSQSSCG